MSSSNIPCRRTWIERCSLRNGRRQGGCGRGTVLGPRLEMTIDANGGGGDGLLKVRNPFDAGGVEHRFQI